MVLGHYCNCDKINFMTDKYIPQNFENKWVEAWEKDKVYQAPAIVDKKNKFYTLVEFPYPSGAGLHVGHARSWTAMDAYSRKKRMQGYQVLYPMGWDAFGLPAENYAIKMGIHPEKTVAENITRFKKQCQALGLSFDWSREINTTDPNYYRWTQWIFIQLYKHGLAYRSEVAVNWCPFCKTNLADEEVLADGTHERCGNKTEKKPQKQWLLKITKYAQRLLDDLKSVDFSENIAKQQINWIGRKEGINISYEVFSSSSTDFFNSNGSPSSLARDIPSRKKSIEDSAVDKIICFTTRPDTNFGATFIVIAPEHAFVASLLNSKLKIQNSKLDEIKKYINEAKSKTEIERIAEGKKKTGVFTGFYAVNNLNGRKMPIWISDFVLPNVGTGAVIGVPGHDRRDFEFAQEMKIDIIRVVVGKDGDESSITKKEQVQELEGKMIDSDFLNGMEIHEATKKIMDYLEQKGWGKRIVNYRIRDWVFSRQHYWGEPIPMIDCPKCGWVTVPEKDLPVKLPYVESYKPTTTGESPLAKIKEFVNTTCPKCGGPAKRETDTMPNWAGSNWYFIRYLDNKNNKEIADRKKMNCWLPVDLYQGGFEHTTLHLLYSRFIYKFLYDIGVVPTSEPYKKRRSHGIVLAKDNRKMSKSFGNVVNPEDVIGEYGADTLRLYELFIGPFEQQVAWSDEAVTGVYRFLTRVWNLSHQVKAINSSSEVKQKINKLIIRIEHDLENLKFNTAVSAAMEFINFWTENQELVDKETVKIFLRILSPMAPFMTEEIWRNVFGEKKSIHLSSWPKAEVVVDTEFTIPVQINGKIRATITVSDTSKDAAVNKALEDNKVKKHLEGKEYKVIYVEKKILNFVLK